MVHFPFRPFPPWRYYPQYTYYGRINPISTIQKNKNNLLNLQDSSGISSNNNFDNSNSSNNRKQKNRPQKYNFAHINLNYLFNSDLEQPIVEFMGIKLYLDDLIIIGLLFFLYKEDVHDEILFSILLLLLLS